MAATPEPGRQITDLLQLLPHGVLLADRRGVIDAANEAAEAIFGFGPGELAGRPVTELLPDRAQLDGDVELPDGVQPPPRRAWWRWRGRRKDGAEVLVEVVLRALRDPAGERFVLSVRDARAVDDEEFRRAIGHLEAKVAERTAQLSEVNAALERETRRTELILEASHEGIYGLDAQGRIGFVNASAAKMLGWEAAELLGANPHERFHLARPDGTPYPPDARWMLDLLADGQARRVDGEIFFRSDGVRIPVEIVGTPAQREGGAVVAFRDVTERRREEDERSRQHALLRRLVKSSPVPTLVSEGLDGRIVFLNRKFVETFGYGPEDVPDIEAWRRLAYPDPSYREEVRRRWREELERGGGQAGPVDEVVRCRDGTVRSLTVHGGLVDGLEICVLLDHTERNWAIETLRANERRLSLLVEQSPLGVVEWNQWGEVVAWNPAVERIFGYTREEVMGCHFSLLVPEERRLNPNHRWEQLRDGGFSAHVAWDGITKDGRVVTCEWHNSRLVDGAGRFVGVASLVLDVTEQKRSDRERRRLWHALEQSPVSVVITDTAGTIGYVNPAFERSSGYTAAEAIGRQPNVLRSGQHPPAFYRQLWETILSGAVWEGEICNRRKTGELYWERVSIAPTRNEEGELTHFIAIKEDVTLRRQWQAELERAREQAEAASRAKSSFLASMSHEIRTPLNAILGYSQVTVRDPQLGEQARHNLEVINRSGEHLLALVNDVLEMSKIEAGRAVVEPTTFDLHAMLEDLEAMFRLRARAKSLLFDVVRTPGVPPLVVADESKVRQVLLNLLANAVKFTPHGSVTLRVSDLRDAAGGLCLRAEVVDTGVGIAPEELPKLFRDFEQTESGRRVQSGTGLGLAISRGYARLMGGDVTVVSTPGRGSTFRFEWPSAEGASAHFGGRRSQRRVLGLRDAVPPPRVLLAGGDEAGRDWLHQLLTSVGFEVRAAGGGAAELVEACRAFRPAAVLLDTQLAGGGVEAARALRAAPGGGAVGIVGVSAGAFEEERRRLREAGADEVLVKPLREDELFEALRPLADVQYVYEDERGGAPDPAPPEPLTAAALAAVPPAVLRSLHEALQRGDVERLVAVAEEAAVAGPAAGRELRGLRALAEAFELEQLERLVTGALARGGTR